MRKTTGGGGGGIKKINTAPEASLKRLACQITAQLPDDLAESIFVLEIARGLLVHLNDREAVIQLAAARETARFSLVSGPEDQLGLLDKSSPA